MRPIHYLSFCVVKLSVFQHDGRQLDIATGFFIENSKDELFLITNWHVVTQRSTLTPSFSKNGAVPTQVKFELHRQHENGIRLEDTEEICVGINVQDGEHPRWLEHPRYGNAVDIVAIPLSGIVSIKQPLTDLDTTDKFAAHPINRFPDLDKSYSPTAMDDVFVIGFPWGLAGAGRILPIYKRGNIASDPIVPQRNLPRFLIDCRTTSSMSGSPVLARSQGIWAPDGLKFDTSINPVINFVGVYAGRLESKDFANASNSKPEITEIGIAWRAELVTEIIEKGVSGTKLSEMAKTAG